MSKIIELDRSVIPACDVPDLETLAKLVEGTASVEGIGGYKIGLELVIPFGMKAVVETIREKSDLPIIYDHQKAATDIPALGKKFAAACKGVDAIILFPQAGPVTEKEWIAAAKEAGFGVIVGGEMTHEGYMESDGGFIREGAPEKIYEIAAGNGVSDFVVPGNKPDKIMHYREFLEGKGIEPVFYSPGLVAQGGEITESATAAGERWHAIVGRGLYQAADINAAARELTAKLR
ncbi:MAG: orotidine 5'-phosphate decarboxylase / HUMPS family protein [Candidatus Diapherotrites archaeon]